MRVSQEEFDKLFEEKMKEYEERHKFKVETKYGNTYIFCEEYDYITQKLEIELSNLFHLMDIEYSIQPKIFDMEHFSFIIDGDDNARAEYIQKFIDNGYRLKWD